MHAFKVIALATTIIAATTLPAAALTVKNSGASEITFGVDTGPSEKVYTLAPATEVKVNEDCSNGCSMSGPWGYSRAAMTGDTVETDGTSLVTVIVPDKPAKAAATTPAKKKYGAGKSKSKKYAAKKAKPAAAKKSPYFKGSFASLFAGKVE
jgi:hypothetical protein